MATPATAPILHTGDIVELRSIGIDEAYLEKFIASNPAILGLGNDVSVVQTQRRQEKAGRLDILLQDGAEERRYEIELMLGSVDESHLIRTIEYWDIERRTYPAYEHCAVLIAENITSRFLNVIMLFSGSVPIIAVQMNAIKVADKTALTFVRIVDSRKLRKDDNRASASTKTSDRASWLEFSGESILNLIDQCTEIINEVATDSRTLNYNQQFIGLMQKGRPNNFVNFNVNKSSLWVNMKLDPVDAWVRRIDDAGLEYRDADWALRVKVTPKSFAENEPLFREMLQEAVAQDQK